MSSTSTAESSTAYLLYIEIYNTVNLIIEQALIIKTQEQQNSNCKLLGVTEQASLQRNNQLVDKSTAVSFARLQELILQYKAATAQFLSCYNTVQQNKSENSLDSIDYANESLPENNSCKYQNLVEENQLLDLKLAEIINSTKCLQNLTKLILSI
ncbi:hypothetical protein BB561_001169 [Smittium simulii]|uniref:Uncharacterized protein n=1 Tax=Smittium simulii TaxID=133385 RepID=A0A2T9YVR3_9FUNG|nr:hypothetical protein BB561_001169 [Smittium simulii]